MDNAPSMTADPASFPAPMPQNHVATDVNANDTKHPLTLFFHIFFKCLAVFAYLFFDLIIDNFIISFIVCIMSLAFDFWVVKNVSGRLLVGLRWWNEVLDDGTSRWVFESKGDSKQNSKYEALMFWGALYLTPACWVVLAIIFSGFEIKWILVCIIAILLSCANVIGYWKCQRDASTRVRNYISQQVAQQVINNSMK